MLSTSNGPDATTAPARKPGGLTFALAAMLVGLLYTAVSVYWSLGGTALLNTVGGALEQGGRAHDLGTILLVWTAVLLKLIGSVLPLLAVRRVGSAMWHRLVRVFGWVEATVLSGYGLVLTGVGILVQAGVIPTSVSADHRALAWHAFLWDPWFLVWGLLVTAALLHSRHRAGHTESPAHRVDLPKPADRG